MPAARACLIPVYSGVEASGLSSKLVLNPGTAANRSTSRPTPSFFQRSARFVDESRMCSHCDVEATVAVGEDLLEIRPMKRLATLEENMEKFFGDELVDKCLPLFCQTPAVCSSRNRHNRACSPYCRFGNADGEFERLVSLGTCCPSGASKMRTNSFTLRPLQGCAEYPHRRSRTGATICPEGDRR